MMTSLFHVVLIAVCLSVPLAAFAGVGTDPSTVGLSDPTNSMMPLMTAPSVPGTDGQAVADSRAITPSYPAPSFKADMLLAQDSSAYMGNVATPSVEMPNMMYPQQYTSPQYQVPQYQGQTGMGQYPQYNGAMVIPPYPSQGNQPYVQGTNPDMMMPYAPQQGMTPQMPGMGMSPYGVQQQQYVSVDLLYNQAMQSYRNRDFQSAMMGFQEVAGRFPQSDLADNAHYWIGEIYYGMKNYPAAIQSFQTVVQMYPQGNKVPDAMVKMGFAYADIGQHNIARTILNDVSMRFSDNTRIRNLAVKKLNALNNLY